jgi:hypothetical protein
MLDLTRPSAANQKIGYKELINACTTIDELQVDLDTATAIVTFFPHCTGFE